MTLRTFYRFALIIPLVGLGTAALLSLFGYGARYYVVGTVAWEFPATLLRMLLVYGLLASWLWVQLGRQPAARLTRLVWQAPLLLVALVVVVDLTIATVSRGGLEPSELVGLLLLTALIVGTIGYAYVGLVMLARGALPPDGHAARSSARAGA